MSAVTALRRVSLLTRHLRATSHAAAATTAGLRAANSASAKAKAPLFAGSGAPVQAHVHSAAATGYTNAAEAYEKGRPDYPAAALQHLTHVLRDARVVVELGAGTGKFTRLLAKHLTAAASASASASASGASTKPLRLIATEPVPAMRRQMLKALRLQSGAPGTATAPAASAAAGVDDSEGVVGAVEVRAGTAEHVPAVASGAADAVVVAQAYHWFDFTKARDEIERVLRPGGVVVLIWNRRDTVTSVLARALDEYMDALLPADGSQPRYSQYKWQCAWRLPSDPKPATAKPGAAKPATAEAKGTGAFAFAPLSLATFAHAQRGPRQMVLDRTMSVSFVAALPPAERERVLQRTNALIDAAATRHGAASAAAGELEFELPYTTDVWTTTKL